MTGEILATRYCSLCNGTSVHHWDWARGVELVQCKTCGLIFCSNISTDLTQKNDTIYNDAYFLGGHNLEKKIKSAQYRSCLQEKRVLEGFRSAGKILDVGCGIGKFYNVLGACWDKHGCDVSETAVNFVRQHNLFAVRQGLLEDMEYAENDFDVLYFRASLHHTINPRKTLSVARKLLAPGGLLVVSMSNNAGGVCGRLFRGRTRSFDYGHTHFFSVSTLRRLLEECGFKVRYQYYPYFGTGYETWKDVPVLLARLWMLHAKARKNDPMAKDDSYLSPPFWGNYVSMYATLAQEEA